MIATKSAKIITYLLYFSMFSNKVAKTEPNPAPIDPTELQIPDIKELSSFNTRYIVF